MCHRAQLFPTHSEGAISPQEEKIPPNLEGHPELPWDRTAQSLARYVISKFNVFTFSMCEFTHLEPQRKKCFLYVYNGDFPHSLIQLISFHIRVLC